MIFDREVPPDTAADPGVGDAEFSDSPDAVGRVVEVADMMSAFAAQRFVRVDAMRRDALADADRSGGRQLHEIAERSVRLELAAALRITEYAADTLLTQAEALVVRYPSVLESLASARMTERHVGILIEVLDEAEADLRSVLLGPAVELAEAHPVGTFRRLVQKLVDTARVVTLSERHEAALKGRRVAVDPAGDGMAWLSAYLPAVEAQAIFGRLTAIGKVLKDHDAETRSLDQLRADALGDLLIDGNTDVHPNEAQGIRAQVAVTVPALALLDTEGGSDRGEPAMVDGVGPIPLNRARELCGGADGWMRILTHPETGVVLSVGRDQYRPPAALRRLVLWRAGRCMAPGCSIPAARCQIDHTIAWEHGGETKVTNLAPLCEGHHPVKHHGGWTVVQLDEGAIEWTSPAGRRYIVQPERRVPVFLPHPASEGPPPF